MSPKVIFEDGNLLVIDKPPGMVVTKAESHSSPTLEDWLSTYYDKLVYHTKPVRMGIVHRLDKDTSGLLVVAKTTNSLENLQAQFKARQVKKQYLALVHGWVKESGRVEGNIGRNPKRHDKFTILEDGREAVTEYEVVKRLAFSDQRLVELLPPLNQKELAKLYAIRYPNYTLVRAKPLTGRTHQIRVHLKYIGHPIVSDPKYGGKKWVRLDLRWCPRMFLHATRLGFYHPVSGKWMEMESELPADLTNCLKLLESNLSS